MAEISVLMAVYNCGKYLKEAVDSIINQTWQDFEFIIIDDGSTDNSLEILNSYRDPRIKIIANQENRGVAYARNVGLEHCTSKYVALMDADDIALPDRLKHEYEFLENNENIDGVYAKFRQMDINGKVMEGEYPNAYYNYKYVKAYMILNNTIANLTAMFRRRVVEQYHLKYDEKRKIASDFKFWCDFLQYGNIVGIDEVLCYYRLRNHSLYNNSPIASRIESERQMQLYNFQQKGFKFSEEEQEILLKIFGVNGKISSIQELVILYEALAKMAKQAVEIGLEYAPEVKIMCKKRFMEKVQQADGLWV